jgi:hypothetical protein
MQEKRRHSVEEGLAKPDQDGGARPDRSFARLASDCLPAGKRLQGLPRYACPPAGVAAPGHQETPCEKHDDGWHDDPARALHASVLPWPRRLEWAISCRWKVSVAAHSDEAISLQIEGLEDGARSPAAPAPRSGATRRSADPTFRAAWGPCMSPRGAMSPKSEPIHSAPKNRPAHSLRIAAGT